MDTLAAIVRNGAIGILQTKQTSLLLTDVEDEEEEEEEEEDLLEEIEGTLWIEETDLEIEEETEEDRRRPRGRFDRNDNLQVR